jgi:hypothetical protein
MKIIKKHTRQKEVIISGPTYQSFDKHVQLLRITLTKTETKIDFGYKADEKYIRGGWITISPATFIRPSHTNEKHILTNATNIPYGPELLHFNSKLEWRYFSLYFPPLPENIEEIDIIEKETINIDPTQFNFYKVRLDELQKQFRLV